MLILCYGNPHYDGGDFPRSDRAISAFCRYARFVAGWFSGVSLDLEVWNEFNGDAADYARVVRAVADALSEHRPRIRVVAGAFEGFNLGWIEALGSAGGIVTADAFSIHPYLHHGRRPPEACLDWMRSVGSVIGRFSAGAPLPLIISEIGWPTHGGPGGLSDMGLEAFLIRFVLLASTFEQVSSVLWYTLRDEDGPTAGGPEFGLTRRDGSAKRAFGAMATMCRLLNRSVSRRLTRDGDRFRVDVSTASGETWRADWTTDGNDRYRTGHGREADQAVGPGTPAWLPSLNRVAER